MEKTSIAFFFAGVIAVLFVLMAQLMKEKQKNTSDMGSLFILGILMNMTFMLSLFTGDAFVLKILYTAVLIIESWVLILFLRYANARNDFWKEYKTVYYRLVITMVILDNILLVVNIFTESLFTFNAVPIMDSIYVRANWSPFLIMHWVGTIILELLVVVVMVRKIFAVASIYRMRYVLGTVVFASAAAANLLSRIISGNMNMITVAIVSIGIVSYYYMYFKYPLIRSLRMKTFAINNMSEPVLMFDYNNNLQVYNDAAKEMLSVYLYYTLEQFSVDNDLQLKIEIPGKDTPRNREYVRTKFMGAKTYLIHLHELWDENDKYVGTLVVYSDITGQEKLKNEATQYATRDQLTGLWNRDYFFEMVTKTIRENPETDFLLIATDIYQFKMFNEILGTETGDDLLLALAQAYRQRYKRNWVFSRISADRFALLIPKDNYKEEVFVHVVDEVLSRKNYSMKVHCYVGVYEVKDRTLSAESMYDRAYMALENIKGNIDQTVAYYDEEILSKRIAETTTLDEMDRALLKNEFVIYLQPQIDIRDGSVVSAEALIRWNKPGVGIVPPNEFIPIFEKNGIIAKLDYYVWELACRQIYFWRELGYMDRSVSVNISAKDFYLSDLYDSITGLVEKYDIDPACLKLEITETAFVLDVKEQMDLVRRLQEYGFIIEIDDFGSGYSSLNSLKDIDVDILKMDLKFFEKAEDSERARRIVTSVINLANDLGMPVIAEGVEKQEDLDMLREAGCQLVQGYYYAKPMSVEEFEGFVSNRKFKDMREIIKEVRN